MEKKHHEIEFKIPKNEKLQRLRTDSSNNEQNIEPHGIRTKQKSYFGTALEPLQFAAKKNNEQRNGKTNKLLKTRTHTRIRILHNFSYWRLHSFNTHCKITKPKFSYRNCCGCLFSWPIVNLILPYSSISIEYTFFQPIPITVYTCSDACRQT